MPATTKAVGRYNAKRSGQYSINQDLREIDSHGLRRVPGTAGAVVPMTGGRGKR